MTTDFENWLIALKGGFSGIELLKIHIEMPLHSGIKLKATGYSSVMSQGQTIRITHAKPLFDFAKEYTRIPQWNVMEIIIDSLNKISVSVLFDEQLQQHAQKMVSDEPR